MTMGTNKPNDRSRLLDLLVRPQCLWTVCDSISERRPDPEKSAVFVGGVDAWLSLYTVQSSLALVDAPTSQPLRIIHPFSSSLQGNTHKQPFNLIFTRTAFLYPPNKCLWMGRESWNTRRELMQTREKHESSTQKRPYSPQGIQTPSWQVPVLTTVLLHPPLNPQLLCTVCREMTHCNLDVWSSVVKLLGSSENTHSGVASGLHPRCWWTEPSRFLLLPLTLRKQSSSLLQLWREEQGL